MAERPARGDLTGEICHWADGYHLNVKLYEQMLSSVFDVLEEGKLLEVATNLTWIHKCSETTISEYLLHTLKHSMIDLAYNSRKWKEFWSFSNQLGEY